MSNNLFDLNDRIFDALDELDAADPDDERAVKKAQTKAKLFGCAIKNASVIAMAARMRTEAETSMAEKVSADRLLVGAPKRDAR